ncbi:response regulator transcription factor [Alkaliphilus serpentinus]|uniref:Stage 0 sporulation protein A homolog n=1 Tax=Alkaliphilus serpentinus TaxID=1482731 RepID=A0A833HP48_9FIRM|nr:response regulator transcription factor [Alkaliphilus serpentinus]KAB3530344.1 response regulator transcription factor [Alkaliphilus serpentinus]
MKILIVDDDALIRDSLKILLELEGDMEVVAAVANGQEALEVCKDSSVDLILMDVRMPIMDGVIATKNIKNLYSHIKIVLLTTFRDDEYIKEALKHGAEGYILKSQSSDSIIESIRMVMKGNVVFEKGIASSLKNFIKKESPTQQLKVELTERELEILKLVGEGLSNKEIANSLYLSEGTVRNYVTSLLEKLELRDRTQLAIFYLKNIEK